MTHDPTPGDEEARYRRSLMALGAVAVLVILGLVAVFLFKQSNDQWECIAANHRNCGQLSSGE